MDEAVKVEDVAAKVVDALKFEDVTNCKSLGQTILEFRIEEIVPKIKSSISKMHGFFVDSAKSVGCLLCDADNHKETDISANTINLAEGYCRNVTENSILPLFYLNYHLKTFYSLISNFLARCDLKGKFNENGSVPPEADLKMDAANIINYQGCFENVNTDKWMASCQFVCDEYNLLNYSEIFAPDLLGYDAATKFIQEKLIAMNQEPKKEGEKPAEGGKPAEGDKAAEENKDKKAEAPASKQERILQRMKFRRDYRKLTDTKPADGAAKTEEKPVEGGDATKEGAEKKEEPPAPTLEDATKDIIFPAGKGEAIKKIKPLYLPNKINPTYISQSVSFDQKIIEDIKKKIETKNADAAKKAQDASAEGGEATTTPASKDGQPPADAATGQTDTATKKSAGFFGNSTHIVSSIMIILIAVLFEKS